MLFTNIMFDQIFPSDVLINHIFNRLSLKQQLELKYLSKQYKNLFKPTIWLYIKNIIDKYLFGLLGEKFSNKLFKIINNDENISIIGSIILQAIHNESYENCSLDILVNDSGIDNNKINKKFSNLVIKNKPFTFEKIINNMQNISKKFMLPVKLYFLFDKLKSSHLTKSIENEVLCSGNRIIKVILVNNFHINLIFESKNIQLVNPLSFCNNRYSKNGLYIKSLYDTLKKECIFKLTEFERGLIFYYDIYRTYVYDLLAKYKKRNYYINCTHELSALLLHNINMNRIFKNVYSIIILIDTYNHHYIASNALIYNGRKILNRNIISLALESRLCDGYRIHHDGRYLFKYSTGEKHLI